MGWHSCDRCSGKTYVLDNPFVELRNRRPSDASDMCCVMAGHLRCLYPDLPVKMLPRIETTGGVATQEQWEKWIASASARHMGFMFLS